MYNCSVGEFIHSQPIIPISEDAVCYNLFLDGAIATTMGLRSIPNSNVFKKIGPNTEPSLQDNDLLLLLYPFTKEENGFAYFDEVLH